MKLILAATLAACIAIGTQSLGQSAAPNPVPAPIPAPSPSSAAHPSLAGTSPAMQSYGQIKVPELFPGFLAGYLDRSALPNSLSLLPPKPADGSAASALDEATSRANLALRGSKRWDQAKLDADLTFPNAAGTFSCAAGIPITEADTPHLYVLLRRSLTDAALSTAAAKSYYKRTRPFVENKQPTCTPNDEASLMKDGSYPSGHTAIGWTWALILTEIAPGSADAILSRGRAFGDSRLVCNVHWQSDVNEGRIMGAGTVARLHADPGFEDDLEAAKTEYAVAVAKGLKPTRDCAAEAAALQIHPETVAH